MFKEKLTHRYYQVISRISSLTISNLLFKYLYNINEEKDCDFHV